MRPIQRPLPTYVGSLSKPSIELNAAGCDEVILYFNVGLKPHNQVKDEMARLMAEVAPGFAGRPGKTRPDNDLSDLITI